MKKTDNYMIKDLVIDEPHSIDNSNYYYSTKGRFPQSRVNLNKTLRNNGGGYSLHKLAAIGAEENFGDFFPSVHHSGKISNKTENLVKPIRNKDPSLCQSYDSKLDNYKNSNNNINNKKITSAFGRTSYSIYNKKEEGIQNLINKRINSNENKKYKYTTGDFNVQLSPVAKIKIYE